MTAGHSPSHDSFFRRQTLLAVLITAGLALPAGAAGPRELSAAERDKVGQAIYQGVKYLIKNQFPAGTWGSGEGGSYEVGYAALPALTLIECGVPTSHPAVLKAADYLRQKAPSLGSTYELALTVLFFDRLNESSDKPLIQLLGLRLVAGQTTSGGWHYSCPVLSTQDAVLLLRGLQDRRFRALGLPDHLKKLPVLQEGAKFPVAPPEATNNSTTQFGVLGIWTARRHNVPVKRTLNLLVKRFRDSQNGDGSWGYEFKSGGGTAGGPSMTCAGLLGMAVGLELALEIEDWYARDKAATDKKLSDKENQEKNKKKLLQDPVIQKALRTLDQHVGTPAGKFEGLPLGDLYFLWSLERVGVFFNLPEFGKKDWYRWGAEMIVANQKPDGQWDRGVAMFKPAADTSLALLFLRRANLTEGLAARLKGDKDLNPNPLAKAPAALPPAPKPVQIVMEPPRPSPAPPPEKKEPAPEKAAPSPAPPTTHVARKEIPSDLVARPSGVSDNPPATRTAAAPAAAPKEESNGTLYLAIGLGVGGVLLLIVAGFLLMSQKNSGSSKSRSGKKRPAKKARARDEDDEDE